MTSNKKQTTRPVQASLAIFAWNEERGIAAMLDSFFNQTLFGELNKRGTVCEVICVPNGCTDSTASVAERVFEEQNRTHPHAASFSLRVANLIERGKLNAWNQFVHSLSAAEAKFMFMMDADILLHRADTLWNILLTLERHPFAHVAVDLPRKDIHFQQRPSLRERMSLAASRVTLSTQAQLCAQLYCIRTQVARNIFMPRDLCACEDGFIKSLVCTDFVTHDPWPDRIRVADDAEHIFEAYTSPRAILKNQKRQIMGQTIVHILVDGALQRLPLSQRRHLGETLKTRESADPDWLKRLIAAHLKRIRFFWRLYPGLLGHSFARLRSLSLINKLACLPAAAARCGAQLLSSFLAHRALKNGCTDYWPRSDKGSLAPLAFSAAARENSPDPASLSPAGSAK
jgi:hypothetical protein